MEISDKSESQNNKDQKIIIKEESILKQAGDNNNFGLINNEVKPSDYNIDETLPDENKIGKKCKLYKPVGNTLFLFLDKYSNPIFIIGVNLLLAPALPMFQRFQGIGRDNNLVMLPPEVQFLLGFYL